MSMELGENRGSNRGSCCVSLNLVISKRPIQEKERPCAVLLKDAEVCLDPMLSLSINLLPNGLASEWGG